MLTSSFTFDSLSSLEFPMKAFDDTIDVCLVSERFVWQLNAALCSTRLCSVIIGGVVGWRSVCLVDVTPVSLARVVNRAEGHRWWRSTSLIDALGTTVLVWE
ncbi:hypothetical protein B1756_04045 [Natrarchaeobaculum aegyptiacum]|uniref:Uncharacterized protein n=1 Tax=Natrarchaeobaculum aegyptiacum TaxID=745377 RepID=A0A2Z2HSG1_9EURY|nr:hypothetical protein B1756_04045 [Natrarchaeobaculum aegyptiacum]